MTPSEWTWRTRRWQTRDESDGDDGWRGVEDDRREEEIALSEIWLNAMLGPDLGDS